MEMFKISFSLRGSRTMDEWIEPCMSREAKSPASEPIRWHAEISKKEVKELEKYRHEQNSVEQKIWKKGPPNALKIDVKIKV